ncbi:hypothetical protein Tco_0391120 [Tanacetum coccineum]
MISSMNVLVRECCPTRGCMRIAMAELRVAVTKILVSIQTWGLWYPRVSGFELTVLSDADHARYLDTRKSTFGGIQFLGDKLVSWMSKKQDCTAMSLSKRG